MSDAGPETTETATCKCARCDGTGQYKKVGKCFKCGGTGMVASKAKRPSLKGMTAEERAEELAIRGYERSCARHGGAEAWDVRREREVAGPAIALVRGAHGGSGKGGGGGYSTGD